MIIKTLLTIVLLITIVVCSASGGKMKITSINFQNNGNLPQKYSCDGEGKSPELTWSDFSQNTKSFALIMEDPDAPSGTFVHFLVMNIPTNITFVKEGSLDIKNAKIIANSSGKNIYVPPCPPSGFHRYIFKIFALSTDMLDNVDKDNFYDQIKPYILDQAEIMAKYNR